MTLWEWMKENGISDEQFAARMGGEFSTYAVAKWRRFERTPKLPELIRIQELTGGAVQPPDFLPDRKPSAASM